MSRAAAFARPRQRGAAILIAMVLLTVVATLASGMVWQQWRSVQVETAERARAQTGWILTGALDWARLILREDGRGNAATHDDLTEPWATPLAEARLSSFLAADKDNNADSGLDAFLGGAIADAQARYSLANLLTTAPLTTGGPATLRVDPAQLTVLEKLCTAVGLPTSVAGQLAGQWLAAVQANQPGSAGQGPLLPQQLDDLGWLGLDAATITALRPVLVILPRDPATPVNLNTASREVLAAVVKDLGLGGADRLVQGRPFKTLADAQAVLGATPVLSDTVVNVKTSYFLVSGRIRLDDRVLEQESLVLRKGQDVQVIQRQRRTALAAAAGR